MSILPRIASAACLLFPALVLAQHAAHEHGVGRLDVAVDGDTIEIMLEGPGHNFVGFEHAPETADQRAAIADARSRLQDGAALFQGLNACTLADLEIEIPEAGHGHGEGHAHGHGREHKHEADHKHAHEHKHKHKDEHKHAHDHKHEDGDEHDHSDWHAHYRYTCPQGVPTQLSLGVFTAFPNTEQLRYQTATAAGQTGGVLTRDAAVLRLP